MKSEGCVNPKIYLWSAVLSRLNKKWAPVRGELAPCAINPRGRGNFHEGQGEVWLRLDHLPPFGRCKMLGVQRNGARSSVALHTCAVYAATLSSGCNSCCNAAHLGTAYCGYPPVLDRFGHRRPVWVPSRSPLWVRSGLRRLSAGRSARGQ